VEIDTDWDLYENSLLDMALDGLKPVLLEGLRTFASVCVGVQHLSITASSRTGLALEPAELFGVLSTMPKLRSFSTNMALFTLTEDDATDDVVPLVMAFLQHLTIEGRLLNRSLIACLSHISWPRLQHVHHALQRWQPADITRLLNNTPQLKSLNISIPSFHGDEPRDIIDVLTDSIKPSLTQLIISTSLNCTCDIVDMHEWKMSFRLLRFTFPNAILHIHSGKQCTPRFGVQLIERTLECDHQFQDGELRMDTSSSSTSESDSESSATSIESDDSDDGSTSDSDSSDSDSSGTEEPSVETSAL
jgi:hypothetical protein